MIYNMRNRQKRQFREYKYNYTYEVVNLINLKSYIGSGSCNCPINEDEYMGSSPTLNEIIENEGKENFIKVILETFTTREKAYDAEDLIHDRFNTGKNPMFYNQSRQTSTGFNFSWKGKKRKPFNEEWKRKLSITSTGNSSKLGMKDSKETLLKKSKAQLGRKHPEEVKRKMSEARKLYWTKKKGAPEL